MSNSIPTQGADDTQRSELLAAARGTALGRLAGTGPLDPDALDVAPTAHGERALRFLAKGFLYVDRLLARVMPASLNPFLHTGAIAVTTLLVALVTGILLLGWYKPSVNLAYESVAAMGLAPWTSGLLRSLHRYSSDACIFFALVHAIRLFFERRFAGARWLAWVTGIVMLGTVWLIGWTSY